MSEVALGSVDAIDLDTNKCTELGFWEGEVLGSSLYILERIKLTANDGKLFGSQQWSTVGTGYGKVELLFLVVWFLSVVWLPVRKMYVLNYFYGMGKRWIAQYL